MSLTRQPTVRDIAIGARYEYTRDLRIRVTVISAAMVALGIWLCFIAQSRVGPVTGSSVLWLLLLVQWCHMRSYATYNPRRPVVSVSAHNAVIIAGVFLLPPVLLPLLAAGYLLRRPVAWHWRVWNLAAAALGLAVSALVWTALQDAGPFQFAVPAALVVLAFWLIESSAANLVNWFADGLSPAESGMWSWSGVRLDLAILSVGALAGTSILLDHRMLVLAAPAVLLVASTCRAIGRAQVSDYDPKTRLLAPHTLDNWGEREVAVSHRRMTPLTAVMIDIDLFRDVNNTYGHRAGDVVLSHVAEQLRSAARSTDLAFRYGGEELTLLLPDSGADVGVVVTERFRNLLAAAPAEVDSLKIPVTVSAGVAQLLPGESLHDVVGRADAALYRAKRDGRDRVAVSVGYEDGDPAVG